MVRFAALFADRTRTSMCLALLDGRAWTAGELARYTGVARSTASEHLDMLVAAGVLSESRQGRHRYLRLADADVAELVETLASFVPPDGGRSRGHGRDSEGGGRTNGEGDGDGDRPRTLRAVTTRAALAQARTCYDHLAGALGVGITDAMTDRGLLSRDGGWAMTAAGLDWLESLGADVHAVRTARRAMVRTCLDWTERRPHLAGSAGAAVCDRFLSAGWIERIGTHRAVRLTADGEVALREQLGLRWPARP